MKAVVAVLALALAAAGWAAFGTLGTADEAGAASAGTPARAARERQRRAALACIGAACDASARREPSPVPTSAASRIDEPADSPTLAFWRRFAANALLEPLLEPEGVLRWSAPSTVHPCLDSSRVSLDGDEPHPGRPLPERPFELQWEFMDCRPLGSDGPSLRGRLTMRVERSAGALLAWVSPHELEVSRHGERLRSSEPFASSLSLAPSPGRE